MRLYQKYANKAKPIADMPHDEIREAAAE